jgi:hypothetical protein
MGAMRRKMKRSGSALTLAARGFAFATAFYAAPVLAQVPGNETLGSGKAQQLFDEARDLIQSGDWRSACPKLLRSQTLDPRPTTMFRLAECYQHVGKNASAWTWYLAAADASEQGGRNERAEFARTRAARIEGILSHVSIHLPAAIEGMTLYLDGEPLDLARRSEAIPVDPGDHTISVRAPGKRAFISVVRVPQEKSAHVVDVPSLEDEPTATRTEGHASATPKDGAAAQAPATQSSTLRPLRVPGLILVGGGAVLGALGMTLYLTGTDGEGCRSGCALGIANISLGGAAIVLGGAFFLASLAGDDGAKASAAWRRPFELRF